MASRSVNKVILVGNCTRDAETKFTLGGVAVTKFSVATNRRWKDKQSDEWKEEVNYTNVVLWQNEKVGEYLTRGKQVYVEGRLQTRSYEKDGQKVYVTEVVADEVLLLGGQEGHSAGGANSQARAAASGGTSKGRASAAAVAEEEYGGMGISDDDAPF